jgi:hypothetical protein
MKKRNLALLALVALLSLSACSLTGNAPVAQSGDQQTQIARAVEQTLAAGEVEPPQPAEDTLEVAPLAPTVTVSVGTNCRTGPGEPYDIIGMLAVGQQAEVIGRNEYGDTWIIRLPSNPSVTCWLWGHYATVVGDTSGLTIYPVPPTPTPAAGFTVAYLNMYHCGGLVGFEFQVVNTGSVTFTYYAATVADLTTAIAPKNFMDDFFRDITPACMTLSVLDDLAPGETGSISNIPAASFSYEPGGHNISATFRLCSQDGGAGICVDRDLSFTP